MATVAFPSGFNLDRSSTFRFHPTETVDVMSDGTMRSRTLTTSQFVTVDCRFMYLSAADKTTLETFILANQANTITWPIDSVNYSGRITGGHSVTMTGPLFSMSFEYYAQVV